MGWRDERETVLRSQPPAPRQNNLEDAGPPFDKPHWRGEIDNLVSEFGRLDPGGGCWEWVKVNLADKWRELMTAMIEIDAAFLERCAGKLQEVIDRARRLYRECVNSWKVAGEK